MSDSWGGITNKQLESLVRRINYVTGYRSEGKEIGLYEMVVEFGGVKLMQLQSIDGENWRDVFASGPITKRDLYNRMSSYLKGMNDILQYKGLK